MDKYLIYSDNGLDGPELISTSNIIEEAVEVAKREMDRDTQRFVTLIDQYGYEHEIVGDTKSQIAALPVE